MAIDFPSSPTEGQYFSDSNGTIWIFHNGNWIIENARFPKRKLTELTDVSPSSYGAMLFNSTSGDWETASYSAGTPSSTHAFKVNYSSNFVTTGSYTDDKVPYNTVEFDYGSNFNTSLNRYVAPVAGWYLLGARVKHQTTGIHFRLFFRKNNSFYDWIGSSYYEERTHTQGFCFVYCSAGDYMEVWCDSRTAYTCDSGNYNFFGGFLIA